MDSNYNGKEHSNPNLSIVTFPTHFLFNRLASISGVDWLSITNIREVVVSSSIEKKLGGLGVILLIRNAKRTSERRKG